MMMMKVQVTSREAIKPVNPTPTHLRRVQLSFLDQISNPHFAPFIFFYDPKSNNDYTTTLKISRTLRQSLGHLLTKFYPLAGRLKRNQYIDCNDDGVHYFEARADCRLSQLLQQPNDSDLNVLLPYRELHDAGELLVAIQVTFFDCGGFAIAMNFSHKMFDGVSLTMFMKWWGDTARGDIEGIVCPKFDLAKSFPPIDMSVAEQDQVTGIFKEDKFVCRSFVFSDASISALKSRHPGNVSRVEALTSFLWSRCVVARSGEKQPAADTIYTVVQAVNLRPRINFPEMSFGNLSWIRMAALVVNNNNKKKSVGEYGADLVMRLREAIKKTEDTDYAKMFQEGRIDLIPNKQNGAKKPSNVEMGDPYNFSSLIRMPVYGADFGWGKPVWFSMATVPFQNTILFVPMPSGKGVQAMINMKEDSMAKLERDKEFMAFTTPFRLLAAHSRI